MKGEKLKVWQGGKKGYIVSTIILLLNCLEDTNDSNGRSKNKWIYFGQVSAWSPVEQSSEVPVSLVSFKLQGAFLIENKGG